MVLYGEAPLQSPTPQGKDPWEHGGGVLLYIGYIGMFGARGYGFLAVLV